MGDYRFRLMRLAFTLSQPIFFDVCCIPSKTI